MCVCVCVSACVYMHACMTLHACTHRWYGDLLVRNRQKTLAVKHYLLAIQHSKGVRANP